LFEKISRWSAVRYDQVDYTIAIAERSLAKSEKRCLGKENLAKAGGFWAILGLWAND
jgi:hypothetical protein